MKATNGNGKLNRIEDCYLVSDLLPSGELYASGGEERMYFDNIPDISDKKSAKYADETGIGRTAPIKAYSNSENRNISVDCHFFVQEKSGDRSAITIMRTIRWLEAHVYPRKEESSPYSPPPIMKIKCKEILSLQELCVILLDYNVKFDSSVPWDEENGCPYKLDVSLNFEAVYNSADLPFAEDIVLSGGE